MKKNIYNFSAKLNTGRTVSLEKYKNKVLLIVNTASRCGFTSQYAELQELYEKYKKDLVVLAFPCNQFGSQEPGNNKEIKQFCSLNYNIKFPIFSKIDVNGDNAHPLFDFLRKELPGVLGSTKIKWNFTKFLIDRKGKPFKRYASSTKPLKIENDIKNLI